MKNGMLFIISMITLRVYSTPNDSTFKNIFDTYSTVFDCSSLYEKPLNSKNIKNWCKIIHSLSLFIKETDINNKKGILRSLYFIQVNNNNLINGIKIIYHQKEHSKKLFKNYRKISSIFKKIEKELTILQKNLSQIITSNTVEKEIIVLIDEIAKLLEDAARRAEADLAQLI